MKPGGILEYDFFVDGLLGVGEADGLALQGIVELLGAVEKGRRALDLPPSGFDAECVHRQGERRQDLGDATAVKGRVDVDHMRIARVIGLSSYPLDGRRSDQRLVLVERMQAQRGFLDGRRCYRHRCFSSLTQTGIEGARRSLVPSGACAYAVVLPCQHLERIGSGLEAHAVFHPPFACIGRMWFHST